MVQYTIVSLGRMKMQHGVIYDYSIQRQQRITLGFVHVDLVFDARPRTCLMKNLTLEIDLENVLQFQTKNEHPRLRYNIKLIVSGFILSFCDLIVK